MNNDVVIVDLDRARELRFGHKALKKLAAITGKEVDKMGEEELDFEELEKIFFYGLERDARENGEQLTMEQMEDILDCAPSYGYLIEKMQEAFNQSFGALPEGNSPAPARGPVNRSQRRGTGTKA